MRGLRCLSPGVGPAVYLAFHPPEAFRVYQVHSEIPALVASIPGEEVSTATRGSRLTPDIIFSGSNNGLQVLSASEDGASVTLSETVSMPVADIALDETESVLYAAVGEAGVLSVAVEAGIQLGPAASLWTPPSGESATAISVLPTAQGLHVVVGTDFGRVLLVLSSSQDALSVSPVVVHSIAGDSPVSNIRGRRDGGLVAVSFSSPGAARLAAVHPSGHA